MDTYGNWLGPPAAPAKRPLRQAGTFCSDSAPFRAILGRPRALSFLRAFLGGGGRRRGAFGAKIRVVGSRANLHPRPNQPPPKPHVFAPISPQKENQHRRLPPYGLKRRRPRFRIPRRVPDALSLLFLAGIYSVAGKMTPMGDFRPGNSSFFRLFRAFFNFRRADGKQNSPRSLPWALFSARAAKRVLRFSPNSVKRGEITPKKRNAPKSRARGEFIAPSSIR